MKIIFVIPNLGPGGAERVISILANSLVRENIGVDIFLLRDRTISYEISRKVNIVHFDRDLLSCAKIESCRIMRNYFKTQKKENEKVVVIPFLDTCLKRVLVATVGLGIRIIASERNDPYQKGENVIARMKANIPYCLANYCVFQTPDARDYYCNIVRKKSAIIMNPLMISDSIKWRGKNSKRIVSVGRLEKQKNQMLLINSFSHIHKEYPDYVLEIYGEGSLNDELTLRINELNLTDSVFLCGYSSSVHHILENSLFFILPSDYEGMSNALIEALAIGMPVITTDHPCGGAKMLVKNGINGVLIPTKNENAMVCAMKQLIENQEFAVEIGEHAYEIREKLCVQNITKKWLNVIERIWKDI